MLQVPLSVFLLGGASANLPLLTLFFTPHTLAVPFLPPTPFKSLSRYAQSYHFAEAFTPRCLLSSEFTATSADRFPFPRPGCVEDGIGNSLGILLNQIKMCEMGASHVQALPHKWTRNDELLFPVLDCWQGKFIKRAQLKLLEFRYVNIVRQKLPPRSRSGYVYISLTGHRSFPARANPSGVPVQAIHFQIE